MEAEQIQDNMARGQIYQLSGENESGSNPDELKPVRAENLRSTYARVCESYHAIDTIRMQLLGLLPLSSAVGIFFLVTNENIGDSVSPLYLGPASLFGFAVTSGVLCFELNGINKCHALINTGKCLEDELQLRGQFLDFPRPALRIINEPFAGGVIYGTVLASWAFLGLQTVMPASSAGWIAGVILAGAFAGVVGYGRYLAKNVKSHCREQLERIEG